METNSYYMGTILPQKSSIYSQTLPSWSLVLNIFMGYGLSCSAAGVEEKCGLNKVIYIA